MRWYSTSKLYDLPVATTFLLIVANVIVFALCCQQIGAGPSLPFGALVPWGALTAAALQPAHYWRLVAYGFLHADPVHLVMDLVSLMICGPMLERRFGPSTFVVVYAAALVGGALASVFAQTGAGVTVGAAGGAFGIVGALFALWILGAKGLSPAFFLSTFGLNAAFLTRSPNVDWVVNLGGLITGMLAVAFLNLLSRTSATWLRCKFPEFVKGNCVCLAASLCLYLYCEPVRLLAPTDAHIVNIGLWLLSTVVLIKLVDCLLAARRGMAAVVVTFAVLNSGASLLLLRALYASGNNGCGVALAKASNAAAHILCADPVSSTAGLAAGAAVITMLAYIYPLQRGLRDVGFVGATLVAERRRSRSLGVA